MEETSCRSVLNDNRGSQMLKRILKTGIIIFVCNALVYTPLLRAEQLSLPSGDLVAPEITQEIYEQSVPPDSDHEIQVKVTDDVGVKHVTLYYRVIGKDEYQRRSMQKVEKSDYYKATVNADEIKPPGIEYYVQAVDLAGNTLLHGYSFSPLSVKIDSAAAQPDLAGSTLPAALETDEEKKGVSKWVWIGLGALAVGALALSGGSSGGDSPPPSDATLSVTASEPTN
jgi:hypothetical protein